MEQQRKPFPDIAVAGRVGPVESLLEQQLLDVARQTSPTAFHGFTEHCRQMVSVDLHAQQTPTFRRPFREVDT